MLISKFVRRLFSAENFRKRPINSPQIITKNYINNINTRNTPLKHTPRSIAQVDSSSIIKFDDLKTIIYQRHPKNQKLLSYESFEEIPGIPIELLREMNVNGIHKPTEIQRQLLGHYFSSSKVDLLIKSHPGSGKSLGYVISLLADYWKAKDTVKIKPKLQSNEAKKTSFKYLIIVPSDLLARQLQNWIEALSKSVEAPRTVILIESFEESFEGGVLDFLITTPEVFRTKLAQGLMDISDLRTIVLDEADALVKPLKRYASVKQREMRLKHPVTSIVLLKELMNLFGRNKLLERPRMIVASATLNRLTRDQLISAGIVMDPIFLEDKSVVKPIKDSSVDENCTSNSVLHHHILLKDPENPDELVNVLFKIVSNNPGKLGALFLPASQSKLGLCELLKCSPKFSNHSIGLLCNYSPQNSEHSDRLLVASDVDCRGIDIPRLAYVIILDLPSSPDAYIHMSGRIGRTGQLNGGNVYTILGTSDDFKKFSSLLNLMVLRSIPFIE